ncbi:MAG TPA: bifunctional nuclease domain-containing protein, partial [Bacteroidales bacterium]|nr:bifunctional nuclease domain-containing protein [Bacteroidales bacterium]
SDAIALALRFKCPIFTTEEIMQRAGIILDFDKESASKPPPAGDSKEHDIKVENKPQSEELKSVRMQDLKSMLDEAVRDENYERASLIRDELNRRKKK